GTSVYSRGQVVDLDQDEAESLIASRFAMAEMPSPSGAIALHLLGEGYEEVTPAPSGGFMGEGDVVVSDPPEHGGPYFESDNIVGIVFPGEIEERFELVKLL